MRPQDDAYFGTTKLSCYLQAIIHSSGMTVTSTIVKRPYTMRRRWKTLY